MLTLQQIETILLTDVEYATELHSASLSSSGSFRKEAAVLLRSVLRRFDNFLFRGLVPDDLKSRLEPCNILPPRRIPTV